MKPLKARITKIDEGKYSRTENVYFRIRFRLETGEFAMTDVVPTYRNFFYWKPVIEAGIGTRIGGVYLKDGGWKPLKVDADSQVFIIQEPLIKEKVKNPDNQALYKVRDGNPEVWKVINSKGKSEEVTITQGFYQCTCEKYRYSIKKKECSDTKKVAAQKALDQKNKQPTLL